jgi:prepilin-type N-terminal cleavage/methylation domain-containing protein
MSLHARKAQGYSMVEILVVLAIFGILSIVGVSMIGNRQGASVRSLLDELEGALTNARMEATSTGRDVAIETWGTWSSAAPLVIAYGDASLLPNGTVVTDNLYGTANRLLAGTAPDPTVAYSQTVAVPFHFLSADVTQSRACVVVATVDTTDWSTAMNALPSGAVNTLITSVDPFKSGDAMYGLVQASNSLFQSATNYVVVSGSSQRFTSNFIIQVVGTSPSAGALPGSPMGLIVVLANGASIYKFYNPGVREGDGKWRRI